MRIHFYIICAVLFTSCLDSGIDGSHCKPMINIITIGDKTGMKTYPIDQSLEYNLITGQGKPYWVFKNVVIDGNSLNYEYDPYLYFIFTIDSIGQIELFGDISISGLSHNIGLNNNKNLNEVYCKIPDYSLDNSKVRNVLYSLQKGDKITDANITYNAETRAVLKDSLYTPSVINKNIQSHDNSYNIVLTPIQNDTLYYPISIHYGICPRKLGWIECINNDNGFTIKEIVVSEPDSK